MNLVEVSWEVCNLVGGIHTVLASKAEQMREHYGEHYLVIGPDLPQSAAEFREEVWDPEIKRILTGFQIGCRMGRWLVPGEPRCLLITFGNLHQSKDKILATYWEQYGLNSLYGGWDYLEPLLFGQAAGLVVEQIFKHHYKPANEKVVVQCHEWMTSSANLFLQKAVPEIGTVFTTHATILARAIFGNNVELTMKTYDGPRLEKMAMDLGVSAKYSMEKIAAKTSDCFTTVSAVTGEECELILGRRPDILLPNALSAQFPDPNLSKAESVARSRTRLLQLAQLTTGFHYDAEETTILISAGRYEFKNKGIDMLLDSAALVNERMRGKSTKKFLIFLTLPAGTVGPRKNLMNAVKGSGRGDVVYCTTHELRDENNDPICRALRETHLLNQPENNVHVVFVPTYLDGTDPLIPEKYYDLLAGADISAFPSFYEPWGYTPAESIAVGVPTITSDLAGFGHWALEQGSWAESGVSVLRRKDILFNASAKELAQELFDFIELPRSKKLELRKAALHTSTKCRWENWSKAYFSAHRLAIAKAAERSRSVQQRVHAPEARQAVRFNPSTHMRNFVVLTTLPKKLEELRDLSRNILWSWDHEAEKLISSLDPALWEKSGRNPTVFLDYVKREFLETAASSPSYLKKLDRVIAKFKKDQDEKPAPSVAFFCAEYGLTSCLRFYSGGLGVLAGDLLKTASDMKLPVVAVGLAYHKGFFEQHINQQGRQESIYKAQDFHTLPMQLVRQPDGEPLTVSVPFPTGPVYVRAWKVLVGTVDLFLLDTDFAANKEENRGITDQLYGGDFIHRLKQEFILGIGGLKLLKAAGISPEIFHMNEGHSAFLVLARLFGLMTERNLSYEEALEYVRSTSIFTTHTPVGAGHDEFPEEVIKPYLSPFSEALHKDWASLVELGRAPQSVNNKFSMTYLCLRGSSRVNGVSEIHGALSRQMFKNLYPGTLDSEVPVRHITNGIHVSTWLAPEWDDVFHRHLGARWSEHLSDAEYWKKLHEVAPSVLWETHQKAKSRLIEWLKKDVERSFRERRENPANLAVTLSNLDQNPLIIGFARRFTPYKRADLVLRNLKKFAKIIGSGRPILFVFGGKSHPSDGPGIELIKKVIETAREPAFAGKVLFVENYDLDVAKLLVSGCDVWLNTPMRPLEASGTSGMKAGINGVLNLSVLDGWWAEGYNGKNGWSISGENENNPEDYQNEFDSERIYTLLEHEVIPTFFERNADGIPLRWVEMMKESMATVIPGFSSHRMLRDYHNYFYEPALKAARELVDDNFAGLRQLAEFKRRIRQAWNSILFADTKIEGLERHRVQMDEPVKISVELIHPGLTGKDVMVQAILSRSLVDQKVSQMQAFPAELVKNDKANGSSLWEAEINFAESGPYSLGVRVLPRRAPGDSEPELCDNLVKWL